MAQIGTLREYIREIERLERRIARAWGASVNRVRQNVTIRAIAQALADGDLDSLDALLLNRSSMRQVLDEIRASFIAGGDQVERAIPPAGHRMTPASVGFVFDVRDTVAEAWLAQHSSDFVTAITEEQRQAVRTLAARGTALGQNPNTTALDLVGRVNRQTGRRDGGIIGLTKPMTQWTIDAADELSTPDGITRYLTRKRRDRRFDALVKRARREGRGLTIAERQRVTGAYRRRLLALRGETVARTESIRAFAAGRHEGIRQAVSAASIPDEFVTRVWDATMDGNTRQDHQLMNETKVQGDGEPFQAPDGSLLLHPGDTSLGASAAQTINCRCYERTDIDFIAAEASRNG